MSTRTYSMGRLYSVFQPMGDPVGGSYIAAVLAQNDGQYISCPTGAYGTFCEQKYGIAYDYLIPLTSTINSATFTVSYAKNYPMLDTFGVVSGVFESATGSAGGTDFPDPDLLTKDATPPTAANLRTESVVVTDAVTLGIVANIPHYTIHTTESRQFPPLGTEINYLDYLSLVINFTLPAPSVVAPDTKVRWTNRLEMSAAVVVPEGGQNASYPITYYWEWTDFDPAVENPPKITYISESAPVLSGNSNARNTPVYSVIPPDFSYTNMQKQLVPGKTYWVRLVAENADNSVESDWTEVKTLTKDIVVI